MKLEEGFTDEVELTFLARHKTNPDAHLLVTTSRVDDIRRALDDLTRRQGVEWTGPPEHDGQTSSGASPGATTGSSASDVAPQSTSAGGSGGGGTPPGPGFPPGFRR
jgi:hypothetical protein